MNPSAIFDKRLVFVTGKGGTGKTTLAAALAAEGARRGRRTLAVEMDSHQAAFKTFLGQSIGYRPGPIRPNLFACNITWEEALLQWLEENVPVQRVNRLILSNRVTRVFLDATPGARETALLSALAGLVESWDFVVVDLPASGHALSLLRVPHVTLRMVQGGPLRTRAEHVLQLFGRSDTSVVLVSLPEEMVVNETLELGESFRRELPELKIDLVVLNRSAPPSLTNDERLVLDRLQNDPSVEGPARELVQAGMWEAGLEESTVRSMTRLEEAFGSRVLSVVGLGMGGSGRMSPARVVDQMAMALARASLKEARS